MLDADNIVRYMQVGNYDSLRIVSNAAVHFKNMISDKPDEIDEVGSSRFVANISQHCTIIHCKCIF